MLIKCSVCSVGYFRSSVLSTSFVCNSCSGKVNSQSQTPIKNSDKNILEELKKEIEEKNKLIAILLNQQQKTSLFLEKIKKNKELDEGNSFTDIEEIKDEEVKIKNAYKPDPSISVQAIIIYIVFISFFLLYFLKDQIKDLL